MYVLQQKPQHWKNKWDTWSERYPTIEEAKAAYDIMSPRTLFPLRIMEEYTYTVTRYKAVNANLLKEEN